MAVEAGSAVELGHSGERIVRDKLFIGGEWVEPSGKGTIEVVDSTTEEVMGRVPEGTPEDVDLAVQAARRAFEEWSQASLAERADACRAIGAAMAARSEELAALIAREVGMPLPLSTMIQAGLPTMSFMSSLRWRSQEIAVGVSGRK